MTAILSPSLSELRRQALERLRELEVGESPCPELWARELAGGDEKLAAPLADLIAQDHARLFGEL